MESQKSLFTNNKNKREMIDKSKNFLFSNYSKIISEFGNLDSKILILGISPVESHYNSESNSCFAFDISTSQTEKSGGVLCKTFDRLGIKIDEVLWDNLYKTPESLLDESSKMIARRYMENFISIINPVIIICLGNDCETIVRKLRINENVIIRKVLHPGAVLRNFYTLQEYYVNWARLNLLKYIK